MVTHDVPPNAKVIGNPAQIIGYVDSPRALPKAEEGPPGSFHKSSQVKGVSFYQMPVITDLRGGLSVGEIEKNLPFAPLRYFVVFDVPSREVRGEHAHKQLHQFLVCLRGECSLVVDDGERREEIWLNTLALGVHLAPPVWGIQYKFSSDALLLVLASDKYDAEDYIRDYDEFRRYVAQPREASSHE